MLFGKKNKKDTMSVEQLKKLDKRSLKYVTERDGETAREMTLGYGGAVNVIDNDLVLVCEGKNVLRMALDKVKAGELMNLSGITIRGFDKDLNRERSVIAYYSDGTVKLTR